VTLTDALHTLIRPTLAELGEPYASPEAECLLLAIGVQESGFLGRVQTHGPARGFWQFEIEAVRDFVWHGEEALQLAVSHSGVMLETSVLYTNLAYPQADPAACILARDLLWRGSLSPLPALEDVEEGWFQYLHAWRPGASKIPAHRRWLRSHALALTTMRG